MVTAIRRATRRIIPIDQYIGVLSRLNNCVIVVSNDFDPSVGFIIGLGLFDVITIIVVVITAVIIIFIVFFCV